MIEFQFPKRRSDQAFILSAQFTTSRPELVSLVRDYVKAWIGAYSTWIRIWRSNVIIVERLDFYAEFLSEPRVENGSGEITFSLVMEGRPTAKLWKDWAAYLISDITKTFPEVRFERFDS